MHIGNKVLCITYSKSLMALHFASWHFALDLIEMQYNWFFSWLACYLYETHKYYIAVYLMKTNVVQQKRKDTMTFYTQRAPKRAIIYKIIDHKQKELYYSRKTRYCNVGVCVSAALYHIITTLNVALARYDIWIVEKYHEYRSKI